MWLMSFLAFLILVFSPNHAVGPGPQCPGNIEVAGHGTVSIIPTGWHDPNIATFGVSSNGELTANMGARAYFAERCNAGKYSNEDYLAMNLLGKTMRYTTDMSNDAGCGCNAAMYLTSLRQNTNPSDCHDYYCDANNVCGQSCAEIDIQEANMFAWHSTLHSASDRFGVGGGYGGGDSWNGARDWNPSQYGPHANCIDTTAPFEVAVSFPVNGGSLSAMQIELTQHGRNCPLHLSLGSYNGMAELSQALQNGMTPVLSYWSSDKMLWMDGRGTDKKGPCAFDSAAACGSSIKFYNFSVSNIGAPPPRPGPPVVVPPAGQKTTQAPPVPTQPPIVRPEPTPAPVPPLPVPPGPIVAPSPSQPATLPPVPAPAPVPLPVPMPFPLPIPPGSEVDGKTAIFDALGALCGTGSSAEAVGNTLLGYVMETMERIHKSKHQEIIYIGATLLGLAFAWDGPSMYRALFTLLFALLAGSMADYEVKAHDFLSDVVSRGVVLGQVSGATALALHMGFEGSQVAWGILLGILGAHGSTPWSEALDHYMHGIRLFFYSNGAILGCLVFTIWRPLFLKTLAPLLAGFLIASGLGALFSRLVLEFGGGSVPIFPPPSMDWVTGADCLLGTRRHGWLPGAFACGLVGLLFMGYGGKHRFVLTIATLLAYIFVNAVSGSIFRAPPLAASWPWPLFGGILWAAGTTASAWRQLKSDNGEVKEAFDNTLTNLRSVKETVKDLPKEVETNGIMPTLRSLRGLEVPRYMPHHDRRADRDPLVDRDRDYEHRRHDDHRGGKGGKGGRGRTGDPSARQITGRRETAHHIERIS